jgi:hypothetical protein
MGVSFKKQRVGGLLERAKFEKWKSDATDFPRKWPTNMGEIFLA